MATWPWPQLAARVTSFSILADEVPEVLCKARERSAKLSVEAAELAAKEIGYFQNNHGRLPSLAVSISRTITTETTKTGLFASVEILALVLATALSAGAA